LLRVVHLPDLLAFLRGPNLNLDSIILGELPVDILIILLRANELTILSLLLKLTALLLRQLRLIIFFNLFPILLLALLICEII